MISSNKLLSLFVALLALRNKSPLEVQGFTPRNHQVRHRIQTVGTDVGSDIRSFFSSPVTKPNRLSTTATNAAGKTNDDNKKNKEQNGEGGPPVNLGLIGQLAANQAVVGSTIWTGGAGYQTLIKNADFSTPLALGLGVLGLVPLLGFSRFVETSESPVVAGLNLSTTMVVLRLFGDKPKPALAFAVAAFLGTITGIVEEVTFRGQLLPKLAEWSTANLGVDDGTGILYGTILSTLIFAALHANPSGLFRGGEAFLDTLVLVAFQLVTGGIFAGLYLTTHNLAVPIIAHALYDFTTFYKTHLDETSRIQYANTEKKMPSSSNFAVETKWKIQRGDKFVQDARETFYLIDTNQDGVLSRKELRVALFSYGINLSKMDSEMVARAADLDRSGSIDFGEFLEFVGPAGSTSKAVKYAILGPV